MNPALWNGAEAWGDGLRFAVEVGATLAFAWSGALEAARRRLDVVGICVVAFLAAFGGGTLRDLLLDQRPFFWVRHVGLLWGVMALGTLAVLLRGRQGSPTERTMLWADAIGLGLFAATGVDQALRTDLPALVAVLMGVITGVFGGVLRDVVCNEVPTVFRDQRPYAICAFAGGWLYVGVLQFGQPAWVALLACVALTGGMRGLALWRDWRLPAGRG